MPIISPNPIANPLWDPILDDHGAEHPVAGQCRWSAPSLTDGVVQLYVDGELRDATVDQSQSSLWLTLDRRAPRAIHLLPVTTEDRWTDYSSVLTAPSRASVCIQIHRGLGLPWDGLLEFLVDGNLLRREPIWSSGDGRAGLGGQFGTGDYGFDSVVGPGFGRADYGSGPLGFDESALVWRVSEPQTDGIGELRAITVDGQIVTTVPVDLTDWNSLTARLEVAIDA